MSPASPDWNKPIWTSYDNNVFLALFCTHKKAVDWIRIEHQSNDRGNEWHHALQENYSIEIANPHSFLPFESKHFFAKVTEAEIKLVSCQLAAAAGI